MVSSPLRGTGYTVTCLHCGAHCPHDAERCSQCHRTLPNPDMHTVALGRRGTAHDFGRHNQTPLPRYASVIVQALASGMCITLDVHTPLVLGRGLGETTHEIIDLTAFDAVQLGVSRRHCRLERAGHYLVLTDLDSSNGTYVNGNLLRSHERCVLSDGDVVTLGNLELKILFRTAAAV